MDRVLLAKLTGGLGDQATLAKRSAALAQVYAAYLPDVIKTETGLDVTVTYAGYESGLSGDLVGDLIEHFAVANGSLRDWSANFTLACGSGFVITLMEHLLGAHPDTIEEALLRELSVIELDMAVTVFDKLATVLKSGVAPMSGFQPKLDAPHNIEDKPKAAFDYPEEFAVAVAMSVTLGKTTSQIKVIVPQKVFLKTTIVPPTPANVSAASDAWAEQIGEQVRRSQVTLEARIRLQPQTLGTISRLAVGDVIPFMDNGDVSVEVSANSKDLYICEFGRSGENYTVRVKDNINSDGDLLKHLMN
ncbi:FliM/FliN family flagellar motor switch protein [Rhizobium sp. RAF56]|jgi:flagellar motor switch protein FliM|uniref:FliM/FliN family flagellar motor switch protein n=1 Tax=Rhizobium sp. RAF56 TaxID=3233062 RepID=UPI003F94A20D